MRRPRDEAFDRPPSRVRGAVMPLEAVGWRGFGFGFILAKMLAGDPSLTLSPT
jgi:hypothetical protein